MTENITAHGLNFDLHVHGLGEQDCSDLGNSMQKSLRALPEAIVTEWWTALDLVGLNQGEYPEAANDVIWDIDDFCSVHIIRATAGHLIYDSGIGASLSSRAKNI